MKNALLLFLILCSYKVAFSQSDPQKLIEGGKTLIELIKTIKTPRPGPKISGRSEPDSCYLKQKTDLCFINAYNRALAIYMYKKTDTGYDQPPLTMKVLGGKEECWYEIPAGIYKYRIEEEQLGLPKIYREGEIKLVACNHMQRTIIE